MRIGFFRHGNCWERWPFVEISRYATVTYYRAWRFFLAIDKV